MVSVSPLGVRNQPDKEKIRLLKGIFSKVRSANQCTNQSAGTPLP